MTAAARPGDEVSPSELIASKLAICDLSSRNPNVMFELGIRQAYGLPTVLISDTATQRIFDVDLIRCVYYDQCLEYRAVLDAQNRVEQAIKDTLNSKDVESGSIVSLAKAKFAEMPNLTSAVSRSKNAMKPIMQRLDSLEDGLERIASMCQRQGRIAVPGLDDESVRSASRKGCWVIRA